MCKRVVSIGAHCLDAELMGGPVLIKYAKEGAHCTFVHLTRGERGNAKKSPEIYGVQLEKEMQAVAKKMGCDAYWLGYPAGNLPEMDAMVRDLTDYLRKEKVDLVITHNRGSLHARHIACHDVSVSAVNRLRKEGYKIDLYFGENCEDLVGFIPQIYVPVSKEEHALWYEGLREYELFRGGVLSVPYDDYYAISLKVRGLEIGVSSAKAYMLAAVCLDNL